MENSKVLNEFIFPEVGLAILIFLHSKPFWAICI